MKQNIDKLLDEITTCYENREKDYSNIKKTLSVMSSEEIIKFIELNVQGQIKKSSENNNAFVFHFYDALKGKIDPELIFEMYFINQSLNASEKIKSEIVGNIMLKDHFYLFQKWSSNNIDGSSSLMIKDLFFYLIDSSFFSENKQIVEKLNDFQKTTLLFLSKEHLFLSNSKSKEEVFKLILSIDTWYKTKIADENMFTILMKEISKSNTQSQEKLLMNLYLSHLDENVIEFCKTNKINLFEIALKNINFNLSKKMLKKYIMTITDNDYLDKDIFPLFLKNPNLMRANYINELYDDYKNILGLEKIIGSKEQQKELFDILTDENSIDYKGYYVIFTKTGRSSSFVKLLDKMAKEPETIEEFKSLNVFTGIAMNRSSIKYNINDIMEKTKVILNKETFEKIINSAIANIVLVNLEDKIIRNELPLRQKAYMEKREIESMISRNKITLKSKKRI